jgi:DNA-binding NtrC family response regulator
VVITDLVMPGAIGGIELLKIAKEKSVEIEVIVITAHSSVDTAVDAMKKGAVDYLEKPVNFDELFLRLEKISEVKALMKNAGDLREAMDVTESSAAQTIQNLEIINSNLQMQLEKLEEILSDSHQDEYSRIEQALQILESR